MIAADSEHDPTRSRELTSTLIDSVSQGVPKAMREVVMLGRELKKRAAEFAAELLARLFFKLSSFSSAVAAHGLRR
jgi:hypothetical protein